MWVLATVSKGNNRRIRSFRYVDDCQSESRTILESLDVSTNLGFFAIASFTILFRYRGRRKSLILQMR